MGPNVSVSTRVSAMIGSGWLKGPNRDMGPVGEDARPPLPARGVRLPSRGPSLAGLFLAEAVEPHHFPTRGPGRRVALLAFGRSLLRRLDLSLGLLRLDLTRLDLTRLGSFLLQF